MCEKLIDQCIHFFLYISWNPRKKTKLIPKLQVNYLTKIFFLPNLYTMNENQTKKMKRLIIVITLLLNIYSVLMFVCMWRRMMIHLKIVFYHYIEDTGLLKRYSFQDQEMNEWIFNVFEWRFLFFVLFQILFVLYGQLCLMIDIVDRYFYLIFSFIRAFVFIVKCCCCLSILFYFCFQPIEWTIFFLIPTNIFSFQYKFFISFFLFCFCLLMTNKHIITAMNWWWG